MEAIAGWGRLRGCDRDNVDPNKVIFKHSEERAFLFLLISAASPLIPAICCEDVRAIRLT